MKLDYFTHHRTILLFTVSGATSAFNARPIRMRRCSQEQPPQKSMPCTGWPFRLFPRFGWHQNKGCVSVYAPYIKQHLGNNLNGQVTLCTDSRTFTVDENSIICFTNVAQLGCTAAGNCTVLDALSLDGDTNLPEAYGNQWSLGSCVFFLEDWMF